MQHEYVLRVDTPLSPEDLKGILHDLNRDLSRYVNPIVCPGCGEQIYSEELVNRCCPLCKCDVFWTELENLLDEFDEKIELTAVENSLLVRLAKWIARKMYKVSKQCRTT